jgi:hypothetical protein
MGMDLGFVKGVSALNIKEKYENWDVARTRFGAPFWRPNAVVIFSPAAITAPAEGAL